MAGIRALHYRKFHRGLAVVVGIQLLLWVAGGLYFSWTNLDAIHGDDLRAPAPPLDLSGKLIGPDRALAVAGCGDTVRALAMVEVLGDPVYRIAFDGPDTGCSVVMVDARSGELRPAVTEQEARAIARAAFLPDVPVAGCRLLETKDVGGHHEYRGGPLPVWQVAFAHPSGARVYVSAADGQVRALRRGSWRVFDFLWMLHTLDFAGRDDINNPVLRLASVLALVTVASGYILWWVTRRRRRG